MTASSKIRRAPSVHPASEPLILGWQEWVALPDLGLPAIKAKIDTGAKTSALHAFTVEPYGRAGTPKVRFGIHPAPRRSDIEVFCSAPVLDQRRVTSSNGESELRYIIATTLQIGDRSWPIEIGLANRDGMSARMLLGRQAIPAGVLIDPRASFHQPRLGFKLYRRKPA
ncbi:MAG: ATP-dependent zinc protease [Hyphomicrobiaceae bacterium]|jgi:ribosomal protein S6--L-glutamate ligase